MSTVWVVLKQFYLFLAIFLVIYFPPETSDATNKCHSSRNTKVFFYEIRKEVISFLSFFCEATGVCLVTTLVSCRSCGGVGGGGGGNLHSRYFITYSLSLLASVGVQPGVM